VVAFSISLVFVAANQFLISMKFKDSTAAFFVRTSWATILAGMTLACVYAFVEFLAKDWIFIPAMARTHGLLNGIGFVLVGLLGWIIELTEIPVRAD